MGRRFDNPADRRATPDDGKRYRRTDDCRARHPPRRTCFGSSTTRRRSRPTTTATAGATTTSTSRGRASPASGRSRASTSPARPTTASTFSQSDEGLADDRRRPVPRHRGDGQRQRLRRLPQFRVGQRLRGRRDRLRQVDRLRRDVHARRGCCTSFIPPTRRTSPTRRRRRPQSRPDDPGFGEGGAGEPGDARDCGDFADHCESGYTFFRRDTQVRATADQFDTAHPDRVYVVYDATKPGTEAPTGTTYGTTESGVGSQAGDLLPPLQRRKRDEGRTKPNRRATDRASDLPGHFRR